MLQCLEWEPSGAFYQSNNAKTSQNGAPGPSLINYSHDIADPTLPPNPRKTILYRPSVTQFVAVSQDIYLKADFLVKWLHFLKFLDIYVYENSHENYIGWILSCNIVIRNRVYRYRKDLLFDNIFWQ